MHPEESGQQQAATLVIVNEREFFIAKCILETRLDALMTRA
jgi:hypothetical protein